VLDDGNEISEGQVYDFAELEYVDRSLLPKSVDDELIARRKVACGHAHC